jgi:predicted aspartyl protease
MKKKIIYLILILISTCCSTELSKDQSCLLMNAYKEKNFFKLDKLMSTIEFNKNNPNLILYKATLDNVFNKPEESNQLINILLDQKPKYFNDTIVKELYFMRSQNAYMLQDYKSAYFNDSIIVNQYSNVCDSSEIEMRQFSISILRSIMDVPKMDINIPENSMIPISRDIAGLQNVSVTIQNDSLNFAFDTGAEFSVIVESLARKHGVKIFEDKVRVGTATNKIVEGHMGLSDIKLGNIEVKNVVFLVLSDSLLTFNNGLYVIKGIIGFPVIYAFKEFTIKDEEVLIISQKNQKSIDRNFAIYGQSIRIRVIANNDTLPFLFDSGNTSTKLFSSFFARYKNEIIDKCKKENVETEGAGGMVKTEAFILDSIAISAGNSTLTMHSVRIYPDEFMSYDKYVYGNFGQDYINKFSEMNMNFVTMNISFIDKKNK